MRKNGSRLISFRQYKLVDLFLFAVILIVFELIIHFAFIAYNGDFMFSPMLPLVLIVMMRWGWPSVFFAVGDGILYCLLNLGAPNFHPAFFAIYIIGNAAIMFLLLFFIYPGKRKIAEKWYFSVLFVIFAWILVCFGRTIVATCFNFGFVASLISNICAELLTLVVALVAILVLRRLDGMFEDQKTYLLRVDKEKRELAEQDEYGEEPIDLDQDALSILKKRDEDL